MIELIVIAYFIGSVLWIVRLNHSIGKLQYRNEVLRGTIRLMELGNPYEPPRRPSPRVEDLPREGPFPGSGLGECES